MNKKEFATFAMALKTYFPKENLLPNQQAMELWFRELADIDYQLAEVALREWVHTSKWSPTIAEIRAMASDVQHGAVKDWGQAWEDVCRSIRKFGSYNVKAALESLDPLTRKATERLGFKELCRSENVMADRANFRMIYEQIAEREKKEQQIALPLREVAKLLQSKEGVQQIESKGISSTNQ